MVQDLAGTSFALSATARDPGTDPGTAQRLEPMAGALRSSLRSLRSLLVEIYPPDLGADGLEAALGDLVATAAPAGVHAVVEVYDVQGASDDAVRLVWRVAQEAVRNALRHAQAENLTVQVGTVGDRLHPRRHRRRRGFDPHRHAAGLGLRSLRDLIREAGGRLDVRSSAGEGTTVHAGGAAMTEPGRSRPGGAGRRPRRGPHRPGPAARRAPATSRWSARPATAPRPRGRPRTRPDVVVMDLQMPGVDGVAATRSILAEELGAEVVVLTSFSDNARIVAALDAGAVGYLLKDADPEDLIEGIRAVSRGGSPLHPKVARQLLTARQAAPAAVDLTPREREVLALVRAGLANKQIARRLGISERTVKAHLTSVFQRIGVTDRTQAALWAERHLLSQSVSSAVRPSVSRSTGSATGSGGGVPPHSGQIDWCAHQPHSALLRGRQSPVSWAVRIACHSASTLRSVASRSLSSGE